MSNQNQTKKKVSIAHVFKTIIWPRRKLLLVGLILIIISRLSGLVLPGASKYLMDDIINGGNYKLLKPLLLIVGGAITVQAITSLIKELNAHYALELRNEG